jgi:hypothetical protein
MLGAIHSTAAVSTQPSSVPVIPTCPGEDVGLGSCASLVEFLDLLLSPETDGVLPSGRQDSIPAQAPVNRPAVTEVLATHEPKSEQQANPRIEGPSADSAARAASGQAASLILWPAAQLANTTPALPTPKVLSDAAQRRVRNNSTIPVTAEQLCRPTPASGGFTSPSDPDQSPAPISTRMTAQSARNPVAFVATISGTPQVGNVPLSGRQDVPVPTEKTGAKPSRSANAADLRQTMETTPPPKVEAEAAGGTKHQPEERQGEDREPRDAVAPEGHRAAPHVPQVQAEVSVGSATGGSERQSVSSAETSNVGSLAQNAAPPAAGKPSTRVREFVLQLPSSLGKRVEVHVAECAGRVRVTVRSGDPQVTDSLRSELGDLVRSVTSKGMRIETWTPASSFPATGLHDLRPATNGAEAGSSQADDWNGRQRQDAPPDDARDRRRTRPDWLAELEERLGKD